MRRIDAPARSAGLAATATTLLALVAVAAGVPALRAPVAHRVTHSTVSGALSESEAIRVMAAVVVAAARDLLAPSPVGSAIVTPDASVAVRATDRALARPVPDDVTPSRRHVDLRRLDLPPPAC